MSNLTGLPPVNPPHCTRSERRKSPRFACGVGTTGRILAGVGQDPELVSVRDISSGGISLILRCKLVPGQVVNVDLFHTVRNFDCQVPMKVVRIDEHTDGNYVLAGAFTRE